VIPVEGKELTESEKKKRYLKSYQRAVRKEQEILEEIQRLRSEKMFPHLAVDGMPKGSSRNDLSEYAALLDEQIELLKKERLNKARRYSDITERINELGDDNERDVLWYRYIKGMKWEEVCVRTGYSWRQTHNIHSRALNHIKLQDCIELHT